MPGSHRKNEFPTVEDDAATKRRFLMHYWPDMLIPVIVEAGAAN